MKNTFIFLFIASLLLFSCTGKKNDGLITGDASALNTSKLFMTSFISEYTPDVKVDTITVTDGKFQINLPAAQSAMYILSDEHGNSGYAFLDGENLKLTAKAAENNKINWNVEGSATDSIYRAYMDQRYIVGNQKILDSLDKLFYAAREKEDKKEMMRIKDESMPYYEHSQTAIRELMEKSVAANKDNLFGLHLYFVNDLINSTFNTEQEIDSVRTHLSGYFTRYKSENFYSMQINERLDNLQKISEGKPAPEIKGKNRKGESFALSNLKGKYVLIDMWSSFCSWCRAETPILKKAYEANKDKNFTILGVSVDRNEDAWKKAIEEDKSDWDHIILDNESIQKMNKEYMILGYPTIILVGPDGRILAKELRGEQLVNTVTDFVTNKK